MKHKICLLWIFTFFLSATAVAQTSPFLGRKAVEEKLTARIMVDGQVFNFARYFQDMKDSSTSLLNLLGVYVSDSGQDVFENGAPNSVNMLLYNLVFTAFAKDVANSCFSTTTLRLSDPFREALDVVCRWPSADAQNPQALENFWLALMAYDAPEAEFTAWRDFFLKSYAGKTAVQTVQDMTFAALFNPSFLLKR